MLTAFFLYIEKSPIVLEYDTYTIIENYAWSFQKSGSTSNLCGYNPTIYLNTNTIETSNNMIKMPLKKLVMPSRFTCIFLFFVQSYSCTFSGDNFLGQL